jgi:hypothetical protein
MDPEEVILRNADLFITHSTFKSDISLDKLKTYLRARKATGEIRVLLNQGGIQQVLVTEHTKLTPAERDEVRRILEME